MPVITKPAHPLHSGSHNLEEASKGSLKKKISPAFGNKVYNRIKASTFTGRSYRVSQKVESSHNELSSGSSLHSDVCVINLHHPP